MPNGDEYPCEPHFIQNCPICQGKADLLVAARLLGAKATRKSYGGRQG